MATLQYAQSGDQVIAYNTQGHGPAVVFAHDLGLDHSVWDAVKAILPQGLRIICYDLRGHGGSSTPPAPYSMGALIRDAEALLDRLEIRNCVFIGSGLGGMVAQGLAVKRLDQIRALVLANTATKIGTKETWCRKFETVDGAGLAAGGERDLEQLLSTGFRQSADIAPWADLLRDRRLNGYLGCASAMAGTDFYTTTASLRLPSLVIACAQDAITPADMVRELAELIPGARLELIRKSGHLPMIEAPGTFASVTIDFLHSIGHF